MTVFPWLDAARAFAALSVLVYHLIAHWDWTGFPASGPLAWFRGGWMAVDLFFVISGFVIGLSAFSRIDAHGSGFRAGFLRARLARIVPLHVLTLLAYVALVEPSLIQRADFWPNLGAHLLFVHNLFFDWYGAINGPNWSLATEMQFYLLMALAAPWLRRARPGSIALASIGIAWAWRWGAWALYQPGPQDVAYMAQTQLPGMLDEFAIGLLLARFVRAPSGQAFLRRLAADARRRCALLALAALGGWAVVSLEQAWDYWEWPAMAVFFRTALAACAALLVLALCGWPPPKRGVLAAGALYLGKVSYGIYLWHLPVLFLLGQHSELEPWQALLVAVPATVALAALGWHAVEQPLLRRWARPAQPAPAGTGTAPARPRPT